jgi:predicted metal-dependent peptidase
MSVGEPPLAREAVGRLRIARQRMVGEYPFHARLIASWQLQATTDIETIGITVEGGAIILAFHPAFVVRCPFAQLVGVLHHLVNHLLFEHPFLEPARFPDPEALMVAAEVTANEWIQEPLPGRPLRLDDFPLLPPNEETAVRYQRLTRAVAAGAGGSAGDDLQGPKGRKTDRTRPNSGRSAPNSARNGRNSVPSRADLSQLHPLDDHGLWDAARQAGPLGRMVVRVRVRAAVRELSPAQWQGLAPPLRARLRDFCAGEVPGGHTETISSTGRGRLDWRRALRHYLREATEVRPVFTRPPRRWPELIGMTPGQLHRPSRGSVMAVLDTSGSITTPLLAVIADELDRLARTHTVTVVECDAAVRAVYPYRRLLRQVHGRGGTDLRPPFDPTLLRRVRPEVIVYFTDGYGPAPRMSPAEPVIWCLTPAGRRPTPWGRELRLSSGEP